MYENKELKRNIKNKPSPSTKKSTSSHLTSSVLQLYSESLSKYNERDYESAIHLLHQALDIDPKNPAILSRLGSVYYTYGFSDYAAHYWKKALDIDPENPNLSSIKKALQNSLL